MAIGKIEIREDLRPLMDRLRSSTGGYFPILNYQDENPHEGPSSLHVPSLFPQVSVPRTLDADWGEVAYGVSHLIRSFSGVPELRGFGNEPNPSIALRIHSELEAIASTKDKVTPIPYPIENLKSSFEQYLKECKDDPAIHIYQGIRLLRLRMQQNPEADAAIDLLRATHSKEAEVAERIFNEVLSFDLNSAYGRARAARIVLQAIGVDMRSFFFHRYSFHPGTTDARSLDYFDRLEQVEQVFTTLISPPYTWLQVQLPFAIPTPEGLYTLDGAAVLLTHTRITNPRATWKGGTGIRIDEMTDPVGLYTQSHIQLRLAGEFSLAANPPAEDLIYKNLSRYPDVVHQAVLVLNTLINSIRRTSGRCDIPDVVPAHFNHIALRQTNPKGEVVRDILSLSLECVRLTAGVPKVDDEIVTDVRQIQPLPFWLQLLETAKLHVIQFNVRRAVLDFSGAFEAFVAEFLTPKVGDLGEDAKSKFLRIYRDRLPSDCAELIEKMAPSASRDQKLHPSIRQIIKRYRAIDAKPALDDAALGLILKVYTHRNEAAHGRPIPNTALEDVSKAIEVLDQVQAGMS